MVFCEHIFLISNKRLVDEHTNGRRKKQFEKIKKQNMSIMFTYGICSQCCNQKKFQGEGVVNKLCFRKLNLFLKKKKIGNIFAVISRVNLKKINFRGVSKKSLKKVIKFILGRVSTPIPQLRPCLLLLKNQPHCGSVPTNFDHNQTNENERFIYAPCMFSASYLMQRNSLTGK